VSTVSNQKGIALILEIIVVALVVAVIAVVVVKTQEGKASRSNGVTGGTEYSQPLENSAPQPTPIDCSTSTQC
jgi:Tfp pilus assembly protein PilE